MRIFAALELPREVLTKVRLWMEPYMSRYSDLKWVSVSRMHVTVRYFGNVEEGVQLRIMETMGEWKPDELDFVLKRAGSFGRLESPSVYWLGGEFSSGVHRLHRALADIPDENGRLDRKRFIPHLTVARRRKTSSLVDFRDPEPIRGNLTGAAVINSRLTPVGPEYTFMERFSKDQLER